MAWFGGALWLSPKGDVKFYPFSDFPQYADATVLGMLNEIRLDEVIEKSGCKVEPLNHSHGWFVYQRLLKEGWKLVSHKRG